MTPAHDSRKDDFRRALDAAGVPYLHVRMTERGPLAVVDAEVLRDLSCDEGRVKGDYIASAGPGDWRALWVDVDGEEHYMTGMTETVAYRRILGMPVGKRKCLSHYVGGPIPVKYHQRAFFRIAVVICISFVYLFILDL